MSFMITQLSPKSWMTHYHDSVYISSSPRGKARFHRRGRCHSCVPSGSLFRLVLAACVGVSLAFAMLCHTLGTVAPLPFRLANPVAGWLRPFLGAAGLLIDSSVRQPPAQSPETWPLGGPDATLSCRSHLFCKHLPLLIQFVVHALLLTLFFLSYHKLVFLGPLPNFIFVGTERAPLPKQVKNERD
jgi:hypothetical protein